MKPYWTNGPCTLYHADARALPLPDESVHMVVTSPPYLGLRNYGIADAIGLEATVEDYVAALVTTFREVWRVLRPDGACWLNLGDSYAGSGKGMNADGTHSDGPKQATNRGSLNVPIRSKQVGRGPGSDRWGGGDWSVAGLAPKNLLLVPARVAIALQADGWWVRSDIVWNKPNPMRESVQDRPTRSHEFVFLLTKSGTPTFWTHRDRPGTRVQPEPDYRWLDQAGGVEYAAEPPQWSEELIDCPDCRGAGWVEVRQGQISMFDGIPALTLTCSRCNYLDAEMPGQVPRWKRVNLWQGHDYFYDPDAVRTEAKDPADALRRISQPNDNNKSVATKERNGLGTRTDKQRGHSRRHAGFNGRWDAMPKAAQQAMGANLLSVWTMATQPFSGAHFATFPEALPGTCILAGTSQRGVCAECGAPWARVSEGTGHINRREAAHVPNNTPSKTDSTGWKPTRVGTLCWRPTCDHDAPVLPAIVLDPFAGSGTTLAVAQRLGRRAVGVDLNPDYLEMASKRIGAVTLPMPRGEAKGA